MLIERNFKNIDEIFPQFREMNSIVNKTIEPHTDTTVLIYQSAKNTRKELHMSRFNDNDRYLWE